MGFLRIFMALAVVVGHSSTVLGYFGLPAHVAVHAFFIISGFYMALITSGKYAGNNGLVAFYTGRFFRLFPLYYLALLITIVIQMWLIGPARPAPWSSEFLTSFEKTLLLVPNATLFGNDLPFLLHHDPTTGWHFSFGLPIEAFPAAERMSRFILVGPSWTLGQELLFYLIVPFLIRLRNIGLSIVALTSIGIRCALETHAPWSSYFFFPANLCFFVAGMLAYQFSKSLLYGKLNDRLPRHTATFALFFVSALLVFRQYIPGYRNYDALVYILVVSSLPWLFAASRTSAFDRELGGLSYPIYILHAPVLLVLEAFGMKAGSWAVPSLACLPLRLFVTSTSLLIVGAKEEYANCCLPMPLNVPPPNINAG
jgi:peptidoglycan/LPS O-acetylase OafA/YrhL